MTTTMIILGIKIFFTSWFITRFKPIEMIIDILPDKLLFNLVRLLLTCLMCVSFWTALIVTGNFIFAVIISFISFWYDKIIGFYENRVRLR